MGWTYSLMPSPVCRHEVSKMMDPFSSILLKWHIIEVALEIGV
jgi:hypothetical protein